MNTKALFNISYGLYLVSTKDKKHNAFIANSIIQATSNPAQIVAVFNKNNFSTQTILKTKKFCICPLTQDTPFSVFENFGFFSGRGKDKFENYSYELSDGGFAYLPQYCNSYMEVEVTQVSDLGTHYMFVCNLIGAKVLSSKKTVDYGYYHQHIKPQNKKEAKKKWVCLICGYVYDGETLPPDFVCPWCGHDVTFFEQQ